jgi:hypothetical protein
MSSKETSVSANTSTSEVDVVAINIMMDDLTTTTTTAASTNSNSIVDRMDDLQLDFSNEKHMYGQDKDNCDDNDDGGEDEGEEGKNDNDDSRSGGNQICDGIPPEVERLSLLTVKRNMSRLDRVRYKTAH